MVEQLDLTLFDLSPIPMWLQDFSGVKKIFQRWKAEGVVDFEHFLLEDLTRLYECLQTIHTIRVNPSTLRLYEAQDLDEILLNFMKFLTPDVTAYQVKFFCALWYGNREYAIPVVNYTCQGKQIDVQLRANVVTGYEDSWALLLLTTEHISDYQNARRFAEAIFQYSPTALWVKDYSAVKKKFDHLKKHGVTDFERYVATHPAFLADCFDSISSIYVNQALLDLFQADDQAMFEQHHQQQFKQHHKQNFYAQLLKLWQGEQLFQRESEYQTIQRQSIFVLEKLNIFPDAKDSWDTIQIAYTDFTERKQLEEHLHYVSKYDQLTQLHNRAFFNDEIARLHDQAVSPIACIYMDVNGLKEVNDQQGHHYGDLLLQRFASILIQTTKNVHCTVSRIGGDEFVILLPYATELDAQQLIQKIEQRLKQENARHAKISVASGCASTEQSENLEHLIKLADQNMYREKKNYYEIIAS